MVFLRCYSGLPALHPSLSFGAALCAFKNAPDIFVADKK